MFGAHQVVSNLVYFFRSGIRIIIILEMEGVVGKEVDEVLAILGTKIDPLPYVNLQVSTKHRVSPLPLALGVSSDH